MTEATYTPTTRLVAWDGEDYKGAGDYYARIRNNEALHLDADEALRLAIYAWNCHADQNGIDLEALLEEEQEAFAGMSMSEADFSRDLVEEVGDLRDFPSWLVIDWQATWDTALRFDFFTYDVVNEDGEYVKFFWRAI